METHFEGVVPTEVVQHDGTTNVVELHFHVSSTHHRVTRVEESPLEELLSDRSYDGSGSTVSTGVGVRGLNKPVLHLRLTNARDLYFLYTLDVDDRTFRIVKERNQLRIGFSDFHRSLTALIEEVLSETEASYSRPPGEGSTHRCQLCLGRPAFSSSPDSPGSVDQSFGRLCFLEMSTFRQSTRLELSLSRGSDSEIKSYLSSELQMYKDRTSDLSSRLRTLQSKFGSTSESLESEIDRLRSEIARVSEGREREVADIRVRLTNEIARLKEDHVMSLKRVLEEKEAEKEGSLSNLRESTQRAVAKSETVVAENVLLTDLKAKLSSQNEVLRSQLDALKGRNSEDLQELERARGRLRELELASVESDKTMKSDSVRIAALDQQVRDKQGQIDQMTELVESLRSQSGQRDEAAEVYKKKAELRQRKLDRCYAEIRKGNTVIRNLQKKNSRSKRRVAELERVLQESDKLVKDREQEILKMKMQAESSQQQLKHRENEIQIKDRQLEEVNLGRDKLMRDLSTQKDLVDHLSTQLNDLQTSSVMSTGISALGRGLSGRYKSSSFFDQSAYSRRYGTAGADMSRTVPTTAQRRSPPRGASAGGLGAFKYSSATMGSGIASELFDDPLRLRPETSGDAAEADIVATEGIGVGERPGASKSSFHQSREVPGGDEGPVILRSGKRQFN